MGRFFFSAISLLAMLSPPFLLGFAWYRLLRKEESPPPSPWRTVLVIRWRAFAGFMVRITPVAILLAVLGRKGTGIPTALTAMAIAYDFVLVDMMA